MNGPIRTYLKNTAAWAPLVIRLALGIIFFAHGMQKVLSDSAIPGLTQMFQGLGAPVPIVFGWGVALIELLGGLAVILGFLTGLASLGIIAVMLGAIATVHFKNGFFLGGGGFEYNLALLTMAVSLILTGPGPYSIDRFIKWRF
jgi:putative oxidoreductase